MESGLLPLFVARRITDRAEHLQEYYDRNIERQKRARSAWVVRAEIARSRASAARRKQRCGVPEATIHEWNERTSFRDRPPHGTPATTHAYPCTARHRPVELRKALLLPLDDLLSILPRSLSASRTGLERCLRRHGVGNLAALTPTRPKELHRGFKAYEHATCTVR